jgi:DNA-binding NarL/FixJ family response regulator
MQRDVPVPGESPRPTHPDPPDAPPTDAESLELSERERQIAGLLVEGLTNKEIAEQLFLSTETIKSYVARILRKLGARNRVQAAVLLARGGMPPASPPGRDGAAGM